MECPIDFTDPAVQADPFPAYDQLRSAHGACRDPKTGIWQVFGYGHVSDAARDARRLSNRGANQRLPTGELAVRY